MKELILQRVIVFFNSLNISETAFAKKIGSNQKTLNQQLKGERSISLDTIINILSAFEDVNSEWLLKGDGDMLKEKIENNISQQGTANTVGNISVHGDYSVGDSHNINLVLPKSGFQKIINSKGEEITIQLDDENLNSVANLSNENKSLVDKIDLLTQMVSDLRERIKEKDEIIGMLRNQIDRT